jgi:hypothetical protein
LAPAVPVNHQRAGWGAGMVFYSVFVYLFSFCIFSSLLMRQSLWTVYSQCVMVVHGQRYGAYRAMDFNFESLSMRKLQVCKLLPSISPALHRVDP